MCNAGGNVLARFSPQIRPFLFAAATSMYYSVFIMDIIPSWISQ